MGKENLVLIRDFLFKTFIVALLFAIFLFVMTISFWDAGSYFIHLKFQVKEEELGKLIVSSFMGLRLFLVFGLLVPLISLHWLIKSRWKQ